MNISLPIVYNKFQSVRVVYRNNFHPQTLYIMYKHITLPQCIMLCVFDTIFTLRKFNCARGVKIVYIKKTIFTLRIDSVPFSCISLHSNFFFLSLFRLFLHFEVVNMAISEWKNILFPFFFYFKRLFLHFQKFVDYSYTSNIILLQKRP